MTTETLPDTYVAVLRRVADFIEDLIEEHPELSMPYVDDYYRAPGRTIWHLTDDKAWKEHAGAIMGELGGRWTSKVVTSFQSVETEESPIGAAALYVPLYEEPVGRCRVDLSALPGLVPS